MVKIKFSYEYNKGASFYEAVYRGREVPRCSGLRIDDRTCSDFVELLKDVYRDFKKSPPQLKLTFSDGISHEQQDLAKTVLDFSNGTQDRFIEDILATDWDSIQQ